MDFTKFDLTPSSKSVIEDARKIAEDFDHLKVIDLHLFYAILCKENANINFSLVVWKLIKPPSLKHFGKFYPATRNPEERKKFTHQRFLIY